MEYKNKRQIGSEKEKLACSFLKKQGYEILTTNFYTKDGELDIVARQGQYLVFLEVKYRTDNRYGFAAEAVTKTKQRRIIKSANYYMYRNACYQNCRFDVVVIEKDTIHLIQNAFEI